MRQLFRIGFLLAAAAVFSGQNAPDKEEPKKPEQPNSEGKEGGKKEEEARKPLFTFVHLTDTHCLTVEGNKVNPPKAAPRYLLGIKIDHWKDLVNSFDVFSCAVRHINEKIKPDFVLHTGDITDKGGLVDMQKGKKILDGLKCPYYACQGDHDVKKTEGVYNYVKVFEKRYLSFNRKGWHFVMMGIYPTDEELEWLAKDLAKNRDKRVIFFTHRLVFADPIVAFAFKRIKIPCLMPKAEEVKGMLKTHGNVVMVLSGHVHTNLTMKDGETRTSYVSTDAIGERPHQFKIFRVFEDHIEIELIAGHTAEKVKKDEWESVKSKKMNLKKKQKEKQRK